MPKYDEQSPRKKKNNKKTSGPQRTPPVLGNSGPQPITTRRVKPKLPYKDRIMRIAEKNDADKLNDLKDKIRDQMESFLTPIAGTGISGAAGNVLKKLKPMKKEMSTGGEVDIDMTTETDV